MHFELISSKHAKMAQEKTDALVLLLPHDAKDYAALPSSIQEPIAFALKNGDLSHDEHGVCSIYRPSDVSARYLVLASLGKEQKSHAFAALQKSLVRAIKPLRDKKIQTLSIAIQPALDALCAGEEDAALTQYEAISSLVQAAEHALYTYRHTKPSAKASPIQKLRFVCDVDKSKLKTLQADFDKAHGVALGIATAREWGNRPANHATPEHLAKAAKDIAKTCPAMACKVLDRKAIEKLGMGAFLAVTQGSAQEPQFIVLEYKGAAKSQAPIALVGKGVTFDTGGISIKPAAQMDEMKFDMCGAASVLGTFEALARLKPCVNVVGLIPACENMPSGTAIKPGDVVTSMSGQTIEILNTDAEGRLILCDALTYAAQYKPSAVIDIATLTGACVIALGGVRAGLFSNDDALAVELTLAGERAGDPCWRMPLDAEYAKGLKSNFADMANVAGREAGAVTAAKFLEKFVNDQAWAHLDIAGVAWKSGADKGATGRPVALLTEFLLSQK